MIHACFRLIELFSEILVKKFPSIECRNPFLWDLDGIHEEKNMGMFGTLNDHYFKNKNDYY